ncbi:hypothetical protein JIN84_05200 [Luteolibacter yonseiensis]|uniref:Uncharacterized protein n=1 Tax=Luteolibacter yonseiensis TaxID=1144680 RepID=A0A934VAC2_9BACT|nr:hypothetical protein [Luteolibacter yonseiensis]MBK1815000.1 hypothetical protein [Luteolibacter yonseiensis]
MSSYDYKFQADRMVDIIHCQFGEEQEYHGLIAYVQPFDSGTFLVGICKAEGSSRRFLRGPAIVRSSRVMKWLERDGGEWECGSFCETTDFVRCATPDDFIDKITGGGGK